MLLLLVQMQCCLLLVSAASSLLPHSVRIDHLVSTHPDLVLETRRPAFDWQLADELASDGRTLLRGITQSQTAYRRVLHSVSVYRDSQRVHSNQSLQVVYGGPPFAFDSSYAWQLQYGAARGRRAGC